MELIAANYAVSETREDADYTLIPMVIEPDPADPTILEARSIVLRLMRNSDNTEVVQVGIGYNDVTDTYDWNLYLIYQAMANVPLTKPGGDGAPSSLSPYNYWRDKTLYLSFAGMYAPQFIIDEDVDKWWPTSPTPFTAAVGLEWQFLDSVAIGVKARPDTLYFEPKKNDGGPKYNLAVPITLRYILKLGDTWMIEPYAGVVLNTPLSSGLDLPLITPMAGLEVGSRLSDMGSIFFFLEAAYDQEVTYEYGTTEHHRGPRIQMLFGIGLKFGFINREIDTETAGEP
jgi:hypothetical protein